VKINYECLNNSYICVTILSVTLCERLGSTPLIWKLLFKKVKKIKSILILKSLNTAQRPPNGMKLAANRRNEHRNHNYKQII
jgi:hypothetical protein